MKGFLIWCFLIVGIAIGISIYLFPKKLEVALIDLKSGRTQDVRKYYQGQYDQGVRAPDMLIAYSQLEETQGNLDGAIDLMKEYYHLNPSDFSALQRLGDLYVANQQYNCYFQTLLELSRVHPNAEVWSDLADWYATENDSQSLFSVLQHLAQTDKADAGNLIDLATLYAEKKEYREGVTLLELRRKIFFRDVTLNDVFFELWLLEKQGIDRTKEIDLISSFLMKKNNPEITYNAINQINDLYPKLIFSVIDRIDPLIKNHPILESAVCEIKWDRSVDQKGTYEQLLALYEKKPVHPQLQNLLFGIELQKGQDRRVIDLIRNTPSKNFTERNLILLSSYAIEQNRPALAREMQKVLLEKSPVVAAALAMAAGDRDAWEQFNAAIQTAVPIEQYELFQIAVAENLESIALLLGSRLYPFIGMPDNQLLEMTLGYIHFKKENEWLLLIQDNENAVVAQIFMDIHLGLTQKVAERLENEKNLNEYVLQVFFTEAEEKKEFPLALLVAKRMQADYPTYVNDANYALALIQNGKEESGLALLKKIWIKHSHDEGIEMSYFNSLVYMAKRNPTRSSFDLRIFMEKREASASIDLLRLFADAYANPLNVFSKAASIYQHLLEQTSPNEQDIQSLVYLWGPRPSSDKIEWLEEKAEQSLPKDRGLWLQGLNQVSDYDFTIRFFSEHRTQNAFFAYLDALVIRKKKEEIKTAIAWGVQHLHLPSDLQKLGAYAEEADMRRAIYQCLVEQRPEDSNAWQQLGKAAYDQHDDQGALCALHRFFVLEGYFDVDALSRHLEIADTPNLYESLYEYGDILEKQRRYPLAKRYFEMALQLINQASEKTYTMREIQSLIDYKITSHTTALNEMHELLEMSGHDPSVSASYANMLMDAGNLNARGADVGENCP